MNVKDSPMDPGLCGENAAPYVLGALTEDEHEAFCRHLDSCAVCREEVAALQVVASVLPAIAPQRSAPQELKRNVMASVREDARREEELGHHMIAATRTRFARRSQLAWPRWRPLLAAGALATVVAVVVIAIASGGGGAGTRVIRAEATPRGADASLHVSDGRAQLDVSGMPQTPPQRVYEVWVKRSGAPQPTDALFTVTAHGDATVGVPGSVRGVKVIMVTAEPLGGSKVPTSSPVIVARLG
jgi:anti-sigma-K factor RskA